MKKKNIVIIIIALVVDIGLFVFGYSTLKKNDQRIRNESIFRIVREYVESDSSFISQYGTILTVNLYQNEGIIVISDKECYVPCVITIESGQSYLVWIDFDFSGEEDVFKYISVNIITEVT